MTTKQQEPIGSDEEKDIYERIAGIEMELTEAIDYLENIERMIINISKENKEINDLLASKDIEIKMKVEKQKHIKEIERYQQAIRDNEQRFNNMLLELKGMVALVRSENERSRNENMAKNIIEPMQEMQNAYNKISLNIFGRMFDLVKELHAKAFIVDEIQKHNPS